MSARNRLNMASRLRDVTAAQFGYFTRSQAVKAGLRDAEVARAVEYGQIERVDTGVYRLVGAPDDDHESLRVAWLRLTPKADPFDRLHRPEVWVSGPSAAQVLRLGDIPADTPEFIAIRRHQPRFEVTVRVRREGVPRDDWVVDKGFPVLSPLRIVVDLYTSGHDGGHVGKVAADALRRGMVTRSELQRTLGTQADLDALLRMAQTG